MTITDSDRNILLKIVSAPWSADNVLVTERCAQGGDGQCDGSSDDGEECECPCHTKTWPAATTIEAVEKWHQAAWSEPVLDDIDSHVSAALEAFWNSISESNLVVETGDLEPAIEEAFTNAALTVFDAWLNANHPARQDGFWE